MMRMVLLLLVAVIGCNSIDSSSSNGENTKIPSQEQTVETHEKTEEKTDNVAQEQAPQEETSPQEQAPQEETLPQEQAPQEEITETVKKAGESLESRTVRLSEAIIVDDIRFTPMRVDSKRVKATTGTTTRLLVLPCKIENLSDQVIEPTTEETLKASYLKDNLGNVIKPFIIELSWKERHKMEKIGLLKVQPGTFVIRTIMSKHSRIIGAEEYTWTVYLVTRPDMRFSSSFPPQDKAIYVKFKGDDIERL